MSLEKSIKKGWERRKPYHRSKSFDATCRPNGSCPHCRDNRLIRTIKERMRTDEDLSDRKARDDREDA